MKSLYKSRNSYNGEFDYSDSCERDFLGGGYYKIKLTRRNLIEAILTTQDENFYSITDLRKKTKQELVEIFF